MRILLVSLNFAPELTGIGKYSGEMADALVDRGHDVTVVCAPPFYPGWQIQAGHRAHGYRTEKPRPGLTIRRCPVWIPKHLGGLSRLLHLASFALSMLPVLLSLVLWRPHVALAVAPALFCAPAVWLIARLTGAKAWLHIQDFEVDAAFELGLLRPPLLRRCALFAERVLMRRFDVVSTISRRMMRRLAAKGVMAGHSAMLPNWVDLAVVRPQGRSNELRSSLGIAPTQVVCLFSGTLNLKQGPDVLVKTAQLLQHDARIVIVICGNGELRCGLEALASGLCNVRFLDLQPASNLNALLNMADIHLLPQRRGAADLVMPSKLAGMLASGRPVVAAAVAGTEIASIAVGCGIVTEPECAAGFASAIVALADEPERRRRLGEAGRAYAEGVLDCEKIFDRLHAHMLALDCEAGERQASPRYDWVEGNATTGAMGATELQ